eukprot:147366_1
MINKNNTINTNLFTIGNIIVLIEITIEIILNMVVGVMFSMQLEQLLLIKKSSESESLNKHKSLTTKNTHGTTPTIHPTTYPITSIISTDASSTTYNNSISSFPTTTNNYSPSPTASTSLFTPTIPSYIPSQIYKPSNTLIIMDFDDTIFPTTALHKFVNANAYMDKTLTLKMEHLGFKILKIIKQLGNTYGYNNIKICSNGTYAWIESALNYASKYCSSWKMLNNIFGVIIGIISAVDYCGHLFPNNYNLWKQETFRNFYKHKIKCGIKYINIVSIGDQWTDHNSVIKALKIEKLQHMVQTHSIKLKPFPKINDMINEWCYIKVGFNVYIN